MRSLWTGAISFGLVNIPIRLYAATESKDLRFNYLHRECHTPVRYAKTCPSCNREITQEEIVRGFEYEKGRYVILADSDLAGLPVPSTRTIEILDFINLSEIDPIYYEKSYYLEPGEGATKPYSLLRQAMLQTGKVAIAKVALRARESLCCLRVYSSALALATMHYPDEVRSVTQLTGSATEPKVSTAELRMAVQLIDNLAAPFDSSKYSDEYRHALLELIESKAAGREIHEAPVPGPVAGEVADLMAALEASLRAVESERDQQAEAITPPARRRKVPPKEPALMGTRHREN